MNHFLDLGTHRFEGLLEFTEKLKIDHSWNVYCYEPNSSVFNQAKPVEESIRNHYNRLEFNNAAVMDRNGTVTFHKHEGAWTDRSKTRFRESYTMGSNSLALNPQYDPVNGVVFEIVDEEVRCVDILNILDNIVSSDDDAAIYIKCDIEGSEFLIVPRILGSPHVTRIKEMHVEWHERFWRDAGLVEQKIMEKTRYISDLNAKGVMCFVH